jgi:hypothetical protein
MPRNNGALTRAAYARITRRLAQLLSKSVEGIAEDDDELYEALDEVPRGESLSSRRKEKRKENRE